MLKHGSNLLDRDAGKPLNEPRNKCTVFEVLEERGNRNSSAAKHPSTTHDLGIAFSCRTRGPIDHGLYGNTKTAETITVSVQLFPISRAMS